MNGRRWATFRRWHGQESFWREVYTRTIGGIGAGLMITLGALALGYVRPPSGEQVLRALPEVARVVLAVAAGLAVSRLQARVRRALELRGARKSFEVAASAEYLPHVVTDAHAPVRGQVVNRSRLPVYEVSYIPWPPLGYPYGQPWPPLELLQPGQDVAFQNSVHLTQSPDNTPVVPRFTVRFRGPDGRRWETDVDGRVQRKLLPTEL